MFLGTRAAAGVGPAPNVDLSGIPRGRYPVRVSTSDPNDTGDSFWVEVGNAVEAEVERVIKLRSSAHAPRLVADILFAHLVVEDALHRYIEAMNPELGNLRDARLSFAGLLAVYKQGPKHFPWLASGIKALNTVRNDIAHHLGETKLAADKLQPMVCVIRDAYRSKQLKFTGEGDPAQTCMEFSFFACMLLRWVSSGTSLIAGEHKRLEQQRTELVEEVRRLLASYGESSGVAS